MAFFLWRAVFSVFLANFLIMLLLRPLPAIIFIEIKSALREPFFFYFFWVYPFFLKGSFLGVPFFALFFFLPFFRYSLDFITRVVFLSNVYYWVRPFLPKNTLEYSFWSNKSVSATRHIDHFHFLGLFCLKTTLINLWC